jgi:hypothetical protein
MAEPAGAGGYRAFGPTGGPLGSFSTLGAALTALEAPSDTGGHRDGRRRPSAAAPSRSA